MQEKVTIRKICAKDDASIAVIIRQSLEDFNAVKQGTVYFDKTTDHLFGLFQVSNATYFIAEINETIVGGGGIYPTNGLGENTCELVKMYVASAARGKGIGKLLLNECIAEARASGYSSMYIETMPELTNAIEMYKKNGFKFIPKALGNSGHVGCDLFMLKHL
ncbi:MAG: GNAT family N-acetyltransferase [Ginsengibacter sp.]